MTTDFKASYFQLYHSIYFKECFEIILEILMKQKYRPDYTK